MNPVLRRLYSRSGKIWLQSLGIAMDEIEDAVPAGVHAGNQVRPGHRTLRRNAGGQQPERSLLSEGRKVRHLALGHELFQKLRVHAVDAENDELLIAVPLSGLAGKRQHGRCAHQQAENKLSGFVAGARWAEILASIIVDVKRRIVWSRAPRPPCVRLLERCDRLDCMFRRIIPALLLALVVVSADFSPGSRQAEYRPHHTGFNPCRPHGLSRRENKTYAEPRWTGRQSMVFEQAYSQAPLTVVSHATILYRNLSSD